MAPINPSNTKRYFLDYEVCGEQHTVCCRTDDATDADDASTAFDSVFTFMAPLLYETTVVRMRVCANGTNISLPATYSGVGTWGTGLGPRSAVPDFWSFTAKDLTGRAVRIDLYGRSSGVNADFRTAAVEDSSVTAALEYLNTASLVWYSIAGNPGFWNPYANIGVNAYWQRQLRL